LKEYLAPVLDRRFDLAEKGAASGGKVQRTLLKLAEAHGRVLDALAEVSIVRVDQESAEPVYVTLFKNVGYENVAHLSSARTLPDEHTLTVAPGVAAAYPNALFRVKAAELNAFVDAIVDGSAGRDYGAFAGRFGVRRNNPKIWEFSDEMHAAQARAQPLESGILDLARLENR
jgi:Fatty acid cis/trans isomerase (CTI)